jgi:hypothetical protein
MVRARFRRTEHIAAERMDAALAGARDLVRRARRNELTMDDYGGTTIRPTRAGSARRLIARLMTGQAASRSARCVPGVVRRGMSDDARPARGQQIIR